MQLSKIAKTIKSYFYITVVIIILLAIGFVVGRCTIKEEIVKPATRTNIPSEPYIESDTVTGIKAEVIDETVYSDTNSDYDLGSWGIGSDYCTFDLDNNLILVVKDGKQIYPDLGIDNTETVPGKVSEPEENIPSEVSIVKLEVQGKKEPVDYLKYYRNRIARTDNIELDNGITIESLIFHYNNETFDIVSAGFKRPYPSVEYRHPFFEFGSEIGYLTGTNGKYLLCSPVGVYVWRIGIKPTVMVGEDLSASYGITLGVRWMP